MMDEEVFEALEAGIKEVLNECEQKIVRLNSEGITLAEISRKIGLSRERVRQMRNISLSKLRRYIALKTGIEYKRTPIPGAQVMPPEDDRAAALRMSCHLEAVERYRASIKGKPPVPKPAPKPSAAELREWKTTYGVGTKPSLGCPHETEVEVEDFILCLDCGRKVNKIEHLILTFYLKR